MRIFLILAISLFYSCVFSQDRVNYVPESFDELSPKLLYSTLWTFNDPTWDSRDNLYSAHDYNFEYIRFAKISSKKKDYYVMISKFNDSAYEYPNLSVGWYQYIAFNYDIYTKEDYEAIKNIKVGDYLKLRYFDSVHMINKDGEKTNKEHIAIKRLKDSITKYEKKIKAYVPSDEFLYVKRTISNGQDVIRFWLPHDCNLYVGKVFINQYWEVDYKLFSKIFLDD